MKEDTHTNALNKQKYLNNIISHLYYKVQNSLYKLTSSTFDSSSQSSPNQIGYSITELTNPPTQNKMYITSDSKYSIISIVSTFSLLFFLQGAQGDDGGWQGGHATFYGGGDASGTMGMTKYLDTLINLLIHMRTLANTWHTKIFRRSLWLRKFV